MTKQFLLTVASGVTVALIVLAIERYGRRNVK